MRAEVDDHRLCTRFKLRHATLAVDCLDLRNFLQYTQLHSLYQFRHVPVLAEAVLAAAKQLPKAEGVLLDVTLGGGGHSALLLESYPGLRMIGLDQDPSARIAASSYLSHFGDRIKIIETNFADYCPDEPVLMLLADLGVSSPQLDVAERGFSFRLDGPLDMRMNPSGCGETAAELLDRLEEPDLANLIYAYGQERRSRRIARRIKIDLANKGTYDGTKDLAYAIAGCYPPKVRWGRIHPATRTFQALRIAVNHELEVLQRLLMQAPEWMEPGGLLGIISFHSLEDRFVKTAFLRDNRLERITRKPVVASNAEEEANPRSRSAKLRLARRRLDI